ncbi:anthranilate synthase component I family protein [Candidatus Gottesmanbacteria bacterium]|nr:anthranilate synthase component I family protein [Candidatus Gottesmanbacteria bacterium]
MGKNIFEDIHLGKYQEEKIDLPLSAFEAFKRLYSSCKNIFLLESLGEEGRYNRYSYVGFDPPVTIESKGKELIVNNRIEKVDNPYTYLSQFSILQRKQKELGGFSGGLVGYFSHEAAKYFEEAFVGYANHEFPDFCFGFYSDGLKFDKKTRKCTYFHHGSSRLRKVYSLLHNSGELEEFSYRNLKAGKGEKDHYVMVSKAKDYIKNGDIFQVVLSLKSYFHISGDTRRIYANLRQINPSPYMIYMKFEEKEIISASPELLIRVKGKEIEHFGTLAGTAKRGRDEKEDTLLEKELLDDEKENAEHMMLVDLARNDVGKISDFGSVRVEKQMSVKKFSHVQHLYSEIRGKLKKKEDAFSALSACFPAGTLTGAPKVEAMKIISELEGESRGPYGGVAGYFSLSGEAMMAILIRSLFIDGNSAYTETGSGIVLDSLAEKEYQEIINKQKAMEEALKNAAM